MASLASHFQNSPLRLYDEPQQTLNRIVIVSVFVDPFIAPMGYTVLRCASRFTSGLQRHGAPGLNPHTRTCTLGSHCEPTSEPINAKS